MSDVAALLRRLGRGLDRLRHIVVNAVFLGLLVALVVIAWRSRAAVPDGAALVLDPRGVLVEQLAADPGDWLVRELSGLPTGRRETLLKDVLDALRLARDDARISALFLDLDELRGGGMSALGAVREALGAFRASRKPIVAYAEGLDQRPYYLAAQADELLLHPDGLVILQGFGGYRPYYKEGLDRFGIEVHVFRAGAYKSAVEPFLRSDMSPEAREAALDVYGDLWRTWLTDVAAARRLEPEELRRTIEAWPGRVREAGGDLAKAALAAGLVDELAPHDRLRARMIDLVGTPDDGKSFRQIGFRTYLAARERDRSPRGRGEGVAVVVTRGDILDGRQPSGRVGGDSTSALIRRAREDEDARAIVLRIDSPGGSVFASELIRRECELAQQTGKPVVASMGSVAASGGYWIATSSDEIWASPTTITGSIGIFAFFPSLHRPLAQYLGVRYDGFGTTPWVDALHPGRPLDPRVAEVIQAAVDEGYEDFLARVVTARGLTPDEADRVARGRIWSGEDAKMLGLVDELGDLDDAIASAARRAKLAEGYRVFYVEPPSSLRDRLVRAIRRGVVALTGDMDRVPHDDASVFPAVGRTLDAIDEELGRLALWNDPRGLYAHCLCGEDWPY